MTHPTAFDEALARAQVDEAIRLRGEGLNYRQIGERFGVHKESVRRAALTPSVVRVMLLIQLVQRLRGGSRLGTSCD